MEVYKRAIVHKLLTSSPAISVHHNIVKHVFNNYERRMMLKSGVTADELKFFYEQQNELYKYCEFINGPELECIEELNNNASDNRFMRYCNYIYYGTVYAYIISCRT